MNNSNLLIPVAIAFVLSLVFVSPKDYDKEKEMKQNYALQDYYQNMLTSKGCHKSLGVLQVTHTTQDKVYVSDHGGRWFYKTSFDDNYCKG